MKKMRFSAMSVAIFGLFFSFSIHSQAQNSVVKIDGSSTVFPITEAMAEEFQSTKKGKVKVTVGVSGTGGGFKKFCKGEIDVQNASRPISQSEMETCKSAGIKYFELPIGYDAIVVVVNPKADWTNQITVEELRKIWEPSAQGKVKTWDQINAKWPKEQIKLYGAGSDSGTFDYFTEAIVGKAKSSRGDYSASEDDNTIVQGVANEKNGLGYFGLSYYLENKAKLKALSIVAVGGKSAVAPSEETVRNGTYNPLARPLFLYVSESAMKKADVKEFVEFYLKNAESIVPSVKYVALPSQVYTMGIEHLNKGKVGTLFDGKASIGLKIEELMKREGRL